MLYVIPILPSKIPKSLKIVFEIFSPFLYVYVLIDDLVSAVRFRSR